MDSKRRAYANNWQRLTALLMAPLIMAATMPLAAVAQVMQQSKQPVFVPNTSSTPGSKSVKVRTGPHKLTKITPKLTFSEQPTDLEITTARIFSEPLIPMSGPAIAGENKALAKALLSFKKQTDQDNISDLTKFLAAFPDSRWRASIDLNLGHRRLDTGYLTEAMNYWSSAWKAAKDDPGPLPRRVADASMAELLELDARLGKADELQKLLAQVDKRQFLGSDEQKVHCAKEGLGRMKRFPEKSFKCGPYAIDSILNIGKAVPKTAQAIDDTKSTSAGTNLLQVKQLADKVGLKYQMAKRSSGATLIVPSVLHWKLKHFGAIVASNKGRFIIKDPTFGPNATMSVSAQALDVETDGYALVPAGTLPPGWSTVGDQEAQTVWGGGAVSGTSRGHYGGPPGICTDPTSCRSGGGPPGCQGMAQATPWLMQAVLHVVDTPLAYSPPLGPPVEVRINNNYLQADQPSTFTFTNFGADWSVNWLSYLTVDPGTGAATLRTGTGESEYYALSGGVYTNDLITQALLVNMGGGTYQRQMPDGSIQVFNQSDTSSPPNIFMTESIDPQGNSVQIQYDSNFRITSITDAISQVTTVAYVSNTVGNSGFYTISQITDPFGRSCSFTYDSTNTYLLSVTDVVGLKSQFTYTTGSSAITSMTTPYGTTSFDQYNIYSGVFFVAEGVRINFPDGTSSVTENWNYTTTYFWDREATALYPNDPQNQVYTHCHTLTWLFQHPIDLEEPILYTDKPALEDVTTYLYANQTGATMTGPSNKPIQITRAFACAPMENATIAGTITAGDVLTITIQNPGLSNINYTVQAGDTLSSIATSFAALINANTTLQQVGITAISSSAVVSIQSLSPLGSTLYSQSTNFGATETITLATAQKQAAAFTVGGTPTVGDTVNILFFFPTFPTATYTVQTGDTLTSIAAGLTAVINADASLPGVSATSSGAVVTTNCFTSFAMNYAPSVGGSATETLTTTFIKNGGVQTTNYQYNSFGRVTQSFDPAGRTFTYTYAANNVDLQEITETQNGDSFVIGDWTYNSQHRPTLYIDGSARQTSYGYNSSQQLISITDPNSKVTKLTYTGTELATIGGSKTTGDVLTITVHDPALAGGQEAVSYTVLSADTLTKIATGLKNAINADTNLQAIGVSATSASTLVTMKSTSVNVTTYTESVSVGATETITLGNNSFGFLTKIDGPLTGSKDITTFAYDAQNRLSKTTDSEGYALNYSYDNMNRLTQTSYPDGTSEQTIYKNLDAVLRKDRIGRWTEDVYDSLDQLSFEIDPLGRKTQYQWCICGSLAKLTDPAGNVTSWNHDLEGRTILKTYADQTSVAYNYDNFTGRLISKTDALKQTTNYWFAQDSTPFAIRYVNAVNPTSTVVYSWDAFFRRITSIANGWGKNSYIYNAYVTNPLGTPITGGGMLATATNNVIANSNITYSYDALGRTTNRSINGSSNSTTWTYDAMSRITAEANPLGSFGYNYVDNVSGSSKGTLRLASINYPNSQVTNFSWYPNIGDQRLKTISNLSPSSTTLSQFDYAYDSAGEITQWQQQQNGNNLFYSLGYDLAGQLTTAQAGSGSPLPPFAQEQYYAYDQAANRSSVQTTSEQTLRVGGTKATSDVLTVTVHDPALSGGQEAVSYTVLSGDTLAKIALGLATAINTDTNLQTLGVNANAHGTNTFVNIRSASNNLTTYTQSTSVGATETMTFGIFKNGVETASIGGSTTTGDLLTITVHDAALAGGQEAVSYTVQAGDTLNSIASGLKTAINADANLSTLGVTATVASAVVSISSISTNATTYTSSTSTNATETLGLLANTNVPATAAIGGSKTTSDVLTLNVYDAALAGGTQALSYTVLAGDTLTSIATGIASAINGNTNLQNIGVSASSSGTVVTILSNSINQTTYRESTNSGASETVSLSIPVSGWQTAVIGGSKTAGDTVSIKFMDSGLGTGQETVTYTVLSTDTLRTIATGLAAAINADTNLSAIGVTASSSAKVVSIESVSPQVTTYSKSTSSGATETITLGTTTGVTQAAYNNVNELIGQAPGGSVRFQGLTNKALTSASVASQVVTIKPTAAPATNFVPSATGQPTETITFGANNYAGNTTATFGGTPKAGDVLSIIVQDAQLTNGPETVSYTVLSTDTTTSIATALALNFNLDATLGNLGITATSSTNVLTISSTNFHQVNSTIYSSSMTGAPSETLSQSTDNNANSSITLGGTTTTGDVVTVIIENENLSGGEASVSYTVAGGDTLSTIASALASAINGSTALQAINISGTSASAVLNIAVGNSTYTQSTSGGATETITFGANNAGNIAATIGGKPTTGDTLTITSHNGAITGGSEPVTYTVLSTDSLVTIAAGLVAAINGDAALQALGTTASNNNAATLAFSQSFSGNGTLPSAASTANNVSGTDGGSNVKTNGIQLSVAPGTSASLTYDLNGNMTSDGNGNSFSWDAENRLVEIVYPGPGNNSQFAYDGLGRNVQILEYVSSSLSSTKQFVWDEDERCEARNASSTITAQYFDDGEIIGGTSYFYDSGEDDSTRELTSSAGAIQAQYSYDPYGQVTRISEAVPADFGYAGYYLHARSGLNLTRTRAYSPTLGRWINRDDLEEAGGVNLYSYAENDPVDLSDPSGELIGAWGLCFYFPALCRKKPRQPLNGGVCASNPNPPPSDDKKKGGGGGGGGGGGDDDNPPVAPPGGTGGKGGGAGGAGGGGNKGGGYKRTRWTQKRKRAQITKDNLLEIFYNKVPKARRSTFMMILYGPNGVEKAMEWLERNGYIDKAGLDTPDF